MSPWLYWPLVAVLLIAFLACLGAAMLCLWIAVVDLYTAWFMRRCRRDPVFFARRVLKVEVTTAQRVALLGHQASRRVGKPRRFSAPYGRHDSVDAIVYALKARLWL